jgi:hypothetical protein
MKAAGIDTAPMKPAAPPPPPDDEEKAKADELEERRVRAAERAADTPRVVINNLPALPTQVTVEAPQVRVEPAVINNHLPEPSITVEAVMPQTAAPQVDVHLPAEGPREQLIERDESGEIRRIVTRPVEGEA